jgi:Icc-related predicted phosphoesterase
MKLQLLSDLHSEFWDAPKRLYERVKIVPNLDFLVIAGDLVVPRRQPEAFVKEAFEHFSKLARHVIYVDGNHEFYGGDLGSVEKILSEVMPDNFHWLVNDERTIEGVHFYGGAMWFGNPDGLNTYFKRQLNDFRLIEGLETWVYERNRMFTMIGQGLIKEETIVVTHHLPHLNSVPEQYKTADTNRFFVSDQTDLIQRAQPRLWFHGHTHKPCDYKLGETRVLCNPYGYPNETYRVYGENQLEYPQVVLDI